MAAVPALGAAHAAARETTSLLDRFARAFNAGNAAALVAELAAPDLLVCTAEGDRRLPESAHAAAVAIERVRRRTGPFLADPMPGSFLELGGGSVLWLAPIAVAGRRATLPVRLTISRSAADKLAIIDLTGGFEPQLTRSADIPSGRAEADASRIVQQAYDALVAEGGGVLLLPPGTIRLNLELKSRQVALAGAGLGATILMAADPRQPILRATYATGSWDEVSVRDLTLQGTGAGIGFAAGHAGYVKDDEFAGRTAFRRVRFDGLEIGILRPAGQIGLRIDACQFESCDYHLHATGVATMHAGVVLARGSHFQRARKAVFYLDSPTVGSGQILFEDCIFEANPGFVFFIAALNGVDAVTGMTVRRCWNEQNGTAEHVTIGRERLAPRFALLRNTPKLSFEDTPVGPLVLRNSHVTTSDCALDLLSLDTDARSTLNHDRVRVFGGRTVSGTTHSVAASFHAPTEASAVFRLRPLLGTTRLPETLASELYERPVALVGSRPATTTSVPGGAIPGQMRIGQVELASGQVAYPAPIDVSTPGWLVWWHIIRVVEGGPVTVEVTGGRGVSAPVAVDTTAWTVLAGVTELPAGARQIAARTTGGKSPTVVQFGGSAFACFDRYEAALAALNSANFPVL